MKKNISVALFVLLLQSGFAFAQTHTIDSLNSLLKTTQQDSNRSLLLAKLAHAYLYSKPDTALILAEQGVDLARSIPFAAGEIAGLNQTGLAFSHTGNYAEALRVFLEALKKSEAIKDDKAISTILNDIASIYSDQGDYKKTLSYLLQAKKISADLQDENILLINLLNLGDCYEKINQLDSARFYTNKAYDLALKINAVDITAKALNNLGNIYSKMGQPDVAMANYRMDMLGYIKEADDEGVCETALGMAKIFLEKGQDDSCLKYAKLSFSIAEKGGFSRRVLNAANFLADYYRQHKVVDSAFTYLLAVIAAKDSLFSQEKTRELQDLSFDETMRQQEVALIKIKEEKEERNNIQFAVIAIALVSFTIFFLLLSRSVIVTEKWIRSLGVLGLLLLFESLNLFINPHISEITHDSPLYMLLILVAIAALLIPLHNILEHWVKEKMVEKNKKIRLEAAKRTVEKLEGERKLKDS